jgi:type III secretory pathway component EscV
MRAERQGTAAQTAKTASESDTTGGEANVTGASTGLARDASERASADALLLVAAIGLLLVPLPAVLADFGRVSLNVQLSAVVGLCIALATATPFFAVPPFVLGCGVGTLLHLVLTAPERFAALEDDRHVALGGRALIATSLLVGGVFAATGLVAAISLFGIA